MLLRHPGLTRTDALFPYTSLVRSPYRTSEKRENHGGTSYRLIFAQIPTEGRFRCCSCLARADEIVDHGILQHALNIAFRFVIGDALNPSQHVHPRQARIDRKSVV